MSFFCDNTLCPRHEQVAGRPKEYEFMEDMAIRRYTAHQHGAIYLCDTCHQAVKLAAEAEASTGTA